MNTAAPYHGRCQTGRVLYTVSHKQRQEACPNRAEPGSMLCAECRAAALSRLPDRAIGDNRGIRWTMGSTLTHGEG